MRLQVLQKGERKQSATQLFGKGDAPGEGEVEHVTDLGPGANPSSY